MLLNSKHNITKVTVEFDDGTVDIYEIKPGTGFIREGYTYIQSDDVSRRVLAVLHEFEIFWYHKKEANAAIQITSQRATSQD